MEQELFDLLSALEMQHEKEKSRRTANGIDALNPDAAKFIAMFAMAKKAQVMVDIGCGVGYSTLWLAYAASKTGGKVIACELDAALVTQLQANLAKAQLTNYVEVLVGDARAMLRNRTETVDLLLIDGDRGQYETYFDVVYKQMEVGGTVIADDVVTEENSLSDYVSYMQNHPNLESLTLPIGDGLEVTVKIKK